MGRISQHSVAHDRALRQARLSRLKGEKKKLESKLAKVGTEILKLDVAGSSHKKNRPDLDRLLDELSDGLKLPPLPADFSRADLYGDHD